MALTPTTIRLEDEVAQKFRDFCSSNGVSQSVGMEMILESVSLDQLKSANPNRATEIEEFAMHMNSILKAFNHSLELNANAEARVRVEFARKLDSDISVIEGLKIDLAEAKEEKKKALDDAKMMILKAKEEVEKMKESKETVDQQLNDALNRIDNLESDLATSKEIADTFRASHHKCEELEIKVSDLSEKEKNLTIKVNELEKEVSKLDREKAELAKDHEIELKNKDLENQKIISELEKKHSEEIKELKEEFDDDYEDLEKEYDEKIEKLTNSHKEEVDLLKNEHKTEVERLRTEIDQLRTMLYSNNR